VEVDELQEHPPSDKSNMGDTIMDDTIILTSDKLSVDSAINMVQVNNAGGISMFIGTTRDHFDGKRVLQLEYECYRPMAEKEMRKICQVIRQKWKVERIALLHRLGVVPVGEASVIAVISSIHRKEALEAVSFAIDSLKTSVPIWKKVRKCLGTVGVILFMTSVTVCTFPS
jgi:molybdopterin synthase catalytic subunit